MSGSRPTAEVEKRYRTSAKGKATRNARQRARRAATHEGRRHRLKYSYGMTEADYDQLLVAQGNACAICLRLPEDGQWKRLKVDHNHATGKIRGLLCHHCNVALGHFGDSQILLQHAQHYLQDDGDWIRRCN